jgi:hypothetical protein
MAKKVTAKQKAAAAAAKAKAASKAAKAATQDTKYQPVNYLSGSKKPGKEYTGWDTYGQGTPDLGKGTGPGDPYHAVKKKIPNRAAAIASYTARKATEKAQSRQTPITGEAVGAKVKSLGKAKSGSVLGKSVNRWNQGSDYRTAAIRRRLQGKKWQL